MYQIFMVLLKKLLLEVFDLHQAPKLYLTLRVLAIEFNSYKVSFVRFAFVEISGFFKVDPRMTQK